MRRRSVLRLAGTGVFALGLAACGNEGDALKPSATVTTLTAGWEQHFKLEWTIEPRPDGGVLLQGSITSSHGARAEPMRLLAQALDTAGAVVGQRIFWVAGGVGGFQRAYFVFPDLPAADRYRVSVWDYSFQQS
jgi:hypothetical protein